MSIIRTFKLVRNEDASGVSGTGEVAEGVEFSNGRCVMCWQTDTSSIAVYDDVLDLINIHGHQGRTVVVFSNGEVVTDEYSPELAIEIFEEEDMAISADGFAVSMEMERLINEGKTWEELPVLLGYPDLDANAFKTLYAIAKSKGVI